MLTGHSGGGRAQDVTPGTVPHPPEEAGSSAPCIHPAVFLPTLPHLPLPVLSTTPLILPTPCSAYGAPRRPRRTHGARQTWQSWTGC